MSLTRRFQVAAKNEIKPGVFPGGLLVANNARFQVLQTPTLTIDPNFFQRTIARESLTPVPGLAGLKTGTLSFGLEMSGHSSGLAGTAPLFALLLNACGFKEYTTLGRLFTGASVGALFKHGDVIKGATSTFEATILHDTIPDSSNAGTFYVHSPTGVFQAETVQVLVDGSPTGPTATIAGDFAAVGTSWAPATDPTLSFTGAPNTLVAGDIIIGATSGATGLVTLQEATKTYYRSYSGNFAAAETVNDSTATRSATSITSLQMEDIPSMSMALLMDGAYTVIKGARGNVSFEHTIGEPVTMQFEFQGVFHIAGDNAPITGVAFDALIPPVFLGANLRFGAPGATDSSAFYTGRITTMSANMNNAIVPRQNASASDGLVDAILTGRAGTVSCDPELDLNASFAWTDRLADAGLIFAEYFVGQTAPNRFYLTSPGLQVTAEPPGDRDGIATRELTFNMTGGADSSSNPGNNNDWVITHIAVEAT